MSSILLSPSTRTPTLRQCLRTTTQHSQVRHATLIKRPKRPYTFNQLVTLSDGSTFMHRTTSPQAVYKATKDLRNAALWNPSSQNLQNVEEDEAGKLRAFREKFGRGWDADSPDYNEGEQEVTEPEVSAKGKEKARASESQTPDYLLDLISGYGVEYAEKNKSNPTANVAAPIKVTKAKKK